MKFIYDVESSILKVLFRWPASDHFISFGLIRKRFYLIKSNIVCIHFTKKKRYLRANETHTHSDRHAEKRVAIVCRFTLILNNVIKNFKNIRHQTKKAIVYQPGCISFHSLLVFCCCSFCYGCNCLPMHLAIQGGFNPALMSINVSENFLYQLIKVLPTTPFL